MSQQTELRALAGIAKRCACETEPSFQRRRHDPGYCLEMFCWAIVDRCPGAWVQRHPSLPTIGEEVQHFLNRAFVKMWAALRSHRFSRFPDLKPLVPRLQICVHSAVLDHARAAERGLVTKEIEGLASRSTTHSSMPENRRWQRS